MQKILPSRKQCKGLTCVSVGHQDRYRHVFEHEVCSASEDEFADPGVRKAPITRRSAPRSRARILRAWPAVRPAVGKPSAVAVTLWRVKAVASSAHGTVRGASSVF